MTLTMIRYVSIWFSNGKIFKIFLYIDIGWYISDVEVKPDENVDYIQYFEHTKQVWSFFVCYFTSSAVKMNLVLVLFVDSFFHEYSFFRCFWLVRNEVRNKPIRFIIIELMLVWLIKKTDNRPTRKNRNI